jgi:plasmid stabilization system protein ParE
MIKVVLSDSAVDDLKGIMDYHARENSLEAGRRVVDQLLEQIEILNDHPDIGRPVPEFGQDNLKELIRPPYRIVYLRQSDSCHVVRVWRSERLLKLPGDAVEDGDK